MAMMTSAMSRSRRPLNMRDIADDETAHSWFQERLATYREELRQLANELSYLVELLGVAGIDAGEGAEARKEGVKKNAGANKDAHAAAADACEGAHTGTSLSQASLRTALAHVPRERALACAVRSDAATIAAFVLAQLLDRAWAHGRRTSVELEQLEEEFERYRCFSATGLPYYSLCDDVADLESLRRLGQLAARLLNDPDAPVLPLCSRYVTADELCPDDLPVDGTDPDAPGPDASPRAGSDPSSPVHDDPPLDDQNIVPSFAFGDTEQFEAFVSWAAGPRVNPRDQKQATLLRAFVAQSTVVDLAEGKSVVLLPRALSDRFDVEVEVPWCLEGMGWNENDAWASPQAERLRVLDTFNAAHPQSMRYFTGTRDFAVSEGPVRVALALCNAEDEHFWYAYPADDAPALVLSPAYALWETLQAVAEEPEWDAAFAERLLSAQYLGDEQVVLDIPRELLPSAGIDANEQEFVVVGSGEVLELWAAEAWHQAEQDNAFDINALFEES